MKSRRSTTIQPQVEGFLRRIAVTSGQRVAAGAVLAEIDNAPQQAAIAALQSTRAARDAGATFARQQAQRTCRVVGVGPRQGGTHPRPVLHVCEPRDRGGYELLCALRAADAELAVRVPGAVCGVTLRDVVGRQLGAWVVCHFNLFRSPEITGSALPGVSSGEALAAQYESWVLPLIILMAVPMAVLGASASRRLTFSGTRPIYDVAGRPSNRQGLLNN